MSQSDALGDALETVEQAADSGPAHALARAGLVARAAIYATIGVIALLLALGSSSRPADQRGAMTELLDHSYGRVLVIALTIGLAGYALWRLSEAAFGAAGHGRQALPWWQSLGRALAYTALTLEALSVLQGSRESQSHKQATLSAQMMAHTGGRFVVVVAGLALAGVGLMMIVEGVRLRFMRYLTKVPTAVRPALVQLGRVGTIGRGVVFALTGALVVTAGWTASPGQAGGMDVAMRTLLDQPYGDALVSVVAVGLLAFGCFGFAEARYRRV
jgi:Domain of Unknown Function (DUF1206)